MLDHVDYRAIGIGGAGTALDCRCKKPLDLQQIGYLGPDLFQMALGNILHLVAAGFTGASEIDDRSHLIGSEPEATSATNE